MLNNLRLFLLAVWLGAALFFSAAVAPSVFSVLRAFALPNASEIAGTLVTRTLAVVNVSGFVISMLLLATALVFRRDFTQRAFLLEVVSVLVIASATGVGQWVIAARMRALHLAMVLPIDQVPADDSRRVAFSELHGYSVAALAIAMIAALVAFVTIAYRARLHAN
jgi:hypothetical protein